ncbi:MAG: ABC transporter ATP-binding protein [Bauldia sp.]|nr:ABC transporter ATP-binding protein [Bauldia sp.]
MDGGSPILEFRRVEKRFGRGRALDGVDLAVRPGELVVLLGQPGAGASTIVRLAAGLLRPDRGSVVLFGQDLRQAGRDLLGRIGIAFEEPDLDPKLTVDGHLRYRAGLLGLARGEGRTMATRALGRFALVERRKDRAGVLSATSRRQLALARAALGSPPIVVADRAVDGLEPDQRRVVLDQLAGLRTEEGAAILLTTAEPAVAEAAARVAVLHRGRMVFDGTGEGFAAAGPGGIAGAFAAIIAASDAAGEA